MAIIYQRLSQFFVCGEDTKWKRIDPEIFKNKISMAMTDISNPMAHQLPLHNHRSGLIQPSLVMNHHLEMDCHTNDTRISKWKILFKLLFWYCFGIVWQGQCDKTKLLFRVQINDIFSLFRSSVISWVICAHIYRRIRCFSVLLNFSIWTI